MALELTQREREIVDEHVGELERMDVEISLVDFLRERAAEEGESRIGDEIETLVAKLEAGATGIGGEGVRPELPRWMRPSSRTAVLLEDRASVVSLGEPVRLSWISMPGFPEVEISASLIEYGDEGVVLVDRVTLELMAFSAWAAAPAGEEQAAEWGRLILAVGPSFEDPDGRPLYDVTELGGGWSQWLDQRVES